jgi:hypothetical protein
VCVSEFVGTVMWELPFRSSSEVRCVIIHSFSCVCIISVRQVHVVWNSHRRIICNFLFYMCVALVLLDSLFGLVQEVDHGPLRIVN